MSLETDFRGSSGRKIYGLRTLKSYFLGRKEMFELKTKFSEQNRTEQPIDLDSRIIFEDGASLDAKELFSTKWYVQTTGRAVTVLRERHGRYLKTPDLWSAGRFIELKTLSGTSLTTFENKLRYAIKQARRDCVIIHLENEYYDLQEVKRIATYRAQRHNLKEFYLLCNCQLVLHLENHATLEMEG